MAGVLININQIAVQPSMANGASIDFNQDRSGDSYCDVIYWR